MRCDLPIAQPELFDLVELAARSAEACTCPRRRLDVDDPWVWGVYNTAMVFEAHGIMWEQGGLADQPRDWWDGVQIVLDEQRLIRKEEEDLKEAKDNINETLKKALG